MAIPRYAVIPPPVLPDFYDEKWEQFVKDDLAGIETQSLPPGAELPPLLRSPSPARANQRTGRGIPSPLPDEQMEMEQQQILRDVLMDDLSRAYSRMRPPENPRLLSGAVHEEDIPPEPVIPTAAQTAIEPNPLIDPIDLLPLVELAKAGVNLAKLTPDMIRYYRIKPEVLKWIDHINGIDTAETAAQHLQLRDLMKSVDRRTGPYIDAVERYKGAWKNPDMERDLINRMVNHPPEVQRRKKLMKFKRDELTDGYMD